MNIQLWLKFSENYRPFRPESGISIGHSGLLFRSESAIFNSCRPMADGRRQSETLYRKMKTAIWTLIAAGTVFDSFIDCLRSKLSVHDKITCKIMTEPDG